MLIKTSVKILNILEDLRDKHFSEMSFYGTCVLGSILIDNETYDFFMENENRNLIEFFYSPSSANFSKFRIYTRLRIVKQK